MMMERSHCSMQCRPVMNCWIKHFSALRDVKEQRTFRRWIQQLTYHIGSLDIAVASLEKHDIIRREREWWFIFPRTRWYFTNPGVQQSLKFKIALTDDASRNERIAGLISLVIAGEDALKHLFRPEEWDDLRTRFKQFIASNPVPPAVKEMMYNSGAGDESDTHHALRRNGKYGRFFIR
jgi:hypothetical protein